MLTNDDTARIEGRLEHAERLAGLSVGVLVLSLQGSPAGAANLLANGSFDAGTYFDFCIFC